VGAMTRRGRLAGQGRPHGIRTEIGLAPENQGRAARLQASVRKNMPFAGTAGQRPQQANTRPPAGPQKDFGSDEPESTCKQAVFLETAEDRPAASPESVRPDADAQADCARQKGLQMKAFSEAADEIRTTTFCMASSTCFPRSVRRIPAKTRGLRQRGRSVIARLSPGAHGSLGTQWAPNYEPRSDHLGPPRLALR